MTSIVTRIFGGMVPRQGNQHLSDEYASLAKNCLLLSGELRPLHAPSKITDFYGGLTHAESADKFGPEIFPAIGPSVAQQPFYITDVTIGQSPITNDNLGYQTVPVSDVYGSVSDANVASKGWTFYRISKYKQAGAIWDYGIAFDNGVSLIPDQDSSWSYHEVENKPGNPSFAQLRYRETFTNYGAESTGTYWTDPDAVEFTVALGLGYEVRFYDWAREQFTLGGALFGSSSGYKQSEFGSLTPTTTAAGFTIFGIWSNGADLYFALEDPLEQFTQYVFGSLILTDGADNIYGSSFGVRAENAVFSYTTIGVKKVALWQWVGLGAASMNEPFDVRLYGLPQVSP